MWQFITLILQSRVNNKFLSIYSSKNRHLENLLKTSRKPHFFSFPFFLLSHTSRGQHRISRQCNLFAGYDIAVVNTWLVALNTVGKFVMTMGYVIIYIWSAEIFTTSFRTSLMGISSMVGRVGQILAPFIADIVSFQFASLFWVEWRSH